MPNHMSHVAIHISIQQITFHRIYRQMNNTVYTNPHQRDVKVCTPLLFVIVFLSWIVFHTI